MSIFKKQHARVVLQFIEIKTDRWERTNNEHNRDQLRPAKLPVCEYISIRGTETVDEIHILNSD